MPTWIKTVALSNAIFSALIVILSDQLKEPSWLVYTAPALVFVFAIVIRAWVRSSLYKSVIEANAYIQQP